MTRIDPRPWTGVALVVAVLAYVGCSSTTTPDRSTSPAVAPGRGSVSGAPAAAKPDAPGGGEKLVSNLGNPAAVLIVTGQKDGYLEPCGCSPEQFGGLVRLYDFVERLHNQNHWTTALIDLGSLTKDPAVARGGFEQAKLKFDYALKALKLMKYDALALSADDLKVGVGEALGYFSNDLGDTTKVVVANVQPAAGYESIFRSSLVVMAGPVKLGVTAVIDPESLRKLTDPDKEALLPKVREPQQVLPHVLAELESKSDYQVLMVQGPPKLANDLARAYPGFEIVVATCEYDEPLNPEPDQLNGGKTLLVTVGHKGKYVGVFGFYPNDTPRLRYYRVTLNKRFNDPAPPMKRLIEEEYRETLKTYGVVENFTRHDYVGEPGATFIGAAKCQSCHPKTYEFWSKTGHARAYTSLERDHKPNTIYDAECISCHTTGFEYNSGWVSADKTPDLKGNQCENCHGPGSKHAADPDNAQYLANIKLTLEQAEKNRLCVRCHDGDNSPKFDFDTYWNKIDHNGLDTYTDPKVHRPSPVVGKAR